MKRGYRIFMILMILLLALGMALLVGGALEHIRRPVAPTTPSGIARAGAVDGLAVGQGTARAGRHVSPDAEGAYV